MPAVSDLERLGGIVNDEPVSEIDSAGGLAGGPEVKVTDSRRVGRREFKDQNPVLLVDVNLNRLAFVFVEDCNRMRQTFVLLVPCDLRRLNVTGVVVEIQCADGYANAVKDNLRGVVSRLGDFNSMTTKGRPFTNTTISGRLVSSSCTVY